jgi:hypothetical protein
LFNKQRRSHVPFGGFVPELEQQQVLNQLSLPWTGNTPGSMDGNIQSK